MSRTSPREDQEIYLGGVYLRLIVTSHWSGFERFMLISKTGQWSCGFNVFPFDGTDEAAKTTPGVYRAFGAWVQVDPKSMAVQNQRAFVRDMTVLKFSESDWRSDLGWDD